MQRSYLSSVTLIEGGRFEEEVAIKLFKFTKMSEHSGSSESGDRPIIELFVKVRSDFNAIFSNSVDFVS